MAALQEGVLWQERVEALSVRPTGREGFVQLGVPRGSVY